MRGSPTISNLRSQISDSRAGLTLIEVLVAVAILGMGIAGIVMAVTLRCDGCIASHARGAATKGATPEEVAEALGVTLLMNGGPGTVYAPRAFDAYLEFRAADAPGPAGV